ncbi:helix-turn-helix domain-containing protein [Glutamicibacter sp. AOP5-A2-18]|uniref:helix-turn-helix domain-containing protein n=1 Tax=Glutamicibacter sp. AOP5-A2-18 TaxID=3457656 RepID=UPI004034ED28
MSFEATNLARKMASSKQFKPGGLHVMLLPADHANEEWKCWPSLALLTMYTCMGERTVRRHLRVLEEHGVLECYALYNSRGGHRIGNQFRLVESEMQRLAAVGEQRRAQMKERMAQRRSTVSHSKAVAVEYGIDRDSEPPANMNVGFSPANSSPAKLADGKNSIFDQDHTPAKSSPAKLADGKNSIFDQDHTPAKSSPAKLADGKNSIFDQDHTPAKSSPAKLADGKNSIFDQDHTPAKSSPAKLADGKNSIFDQDHTPAKSSPAKLAKILRCFQRNTHVLT